MTGQLLDTGPLVALLNRRDRFHEWARERWAEATQPMLTCEAVLAEACHLLRANPAGPAAVIEMVSRGLVEVPFQLAQDVASISRLLKRYSDVPISLADACLVRMSEINADHSVLTLDSDFRIYRRNGRQVIPVTMPGPY